jgi:hypothetical protein
MNIAAASPSLAKIIGRKIGVENRPWPRFPAFVLLQETFRSGYFFAPVRHEAASLPFFK